MFSHTAEYALRAVMFLARKGDKPSSSELISEEMQIPRAYLSKVMRGLVVSKIVDSLLGPNGGFVMKRSIKNVTVLDVVNAVDPIRRITECPLGRPEHVKLCPLHRQMDAAIAHVESTLRSVTIAQLHDMDHSVGPQGLVQINTGNHSAGSRRERTAKKNRTG